MPDQQCSGPSGRWPVWSPGALPIDPAAPAFHASADRFEVWRAARRAHPVAWTESEEFGGFWSVTSHGFARQVLQNPLVFASTAGMRLGSNPRSVAMASGRLLVVTDGTAHRRLRAAHSAWLSSSTIDRISAEIWRDIELVVTGLIDRGGSFDGRGELGTVIAHQVLGRVLGLPRQDWTELGRLTDAAYATNTVEESTQAHGDLLMYLYGLLEQRRAQPRDDFVTALAQSSVDGRLLTDDEVLLNCDGMLSGGLETTPLAVCGALVVFAQDPDCWQRLRAQPERIDAAIEEILRWTSPAAHVMRTALTDTTLGEVSIRAGDRVVLWIAAANRDEAVFSDAERFVLDRDQNPHLALGSGPHSCVGAVLARLELRALLTVLTRVASSITLTGRQEYRHSNFLHGHEIAELTLAP